MASIKGVILRGLERAGYAVIHVEALRRERHAAEENLQCLWEARAETTRLRSELAKLAPFPASALQVGPQAFSKQEILKLHKAPLYSIEDMALTDGGIDVVGIVLAPDGDPLRVAPKLDPDVSFEWHYPLPSPDAVEYYWYWPGAEQSRYRLRLNLASSHGTEEAFRVRLQFDSEQIRHSELKDSFFIPKDLRRYQNYPAQSNLARVGVDTTGSVVVRGYSDYRRIRALAEHYGVDLSHARVLDWGCGHGRVIRHFDEIGRDIQLYATDIEAENANWAKQNLPHVSVTHGPLMPPLPYGAATFDLVFGISVMTHLTESVQKAWLYELERITRAGGLALLTFSGDTDVAYTSRVLGRAYLENYLRAGRGWDLPSGDLAGKIEDPSYYRNVKVSPRVVRDLCNPYFEVLDVLECMFGYQDLAVLKRR